MKLSKISNRASVLMAILAVVLFFGCLLKIQSSSTFAEGDSDTYTEVIEKHVTFYDDGEKLTVKTNAATVKEALDRAGIIINNGDIVEPNIDSEINMDNFYINIYRAHPVIIKDGLTDKYIMTASYDLKTIVHEAGFTIYDGDEIEQLPNTNFLETGIANVYKIIRNGGRTITVEEEIPFKEETVKDASLATGNSEVRQLGEVGTKRVNYEVFYVDNKEVSRKKISEEVIRQPVSRITAIGAKRSLPPDSATCVEWVRQAGVAESDIEYAIQLIYRESGCRVDAQNSSSGAYGIPQALPGEKMATFGSDWKTNPVTQIRWMASYVANRWGGWAGALEQQVNKGWY